MLALDTWPSFPTLTAIHYVLETYGLGPLRLLLCGLTKCSTAGWKYYGLNRGEHEGKEGIWYREWAPGARVSPLPDTSQALHSLSLCPT